MALDQTRIHHHHHHHHLLHHLFYIFSGEFSSQANNSWITMSFLPLPWASFLKKPPGPLGPWAVIHGKPSQRCPKCLTFGSSDEGDRPTFNLQWGIGMVDSGRYKYTTNFFSRFGIVSGFIRCIRVFAGHPPVLRGNTAEILWGMVVIQTFAKRKLYMLQVHQ